MRILVLSMLPFIPKRSSRTCGNSLRSTGMKTEPVTSAIQTTIRMLVTAATLVWFCCPVRAAQAAEISARQLWDILNAKDQVFDNAELDYTVRGAKVFQPLVDWQHPPTGGFGTEKPETLEVIYHEQMAVRGPEVTFHRQLDESVKPTKSGRSVSGYEKQSNAKGLNRSFTKVWESGKGNSVLEIAPGGHPGNPLGDYRAKVEYTLGIGFGKRITSIDSLVPKGDGYVASGKITLWWTDQSTFAIELDKDFIVRRAHMETNLESSVMTYDITTSGVTGERGFNVAKGGSYRQSKTPKSKDGKLAGNPGPEDEKQITFDAVRLNLTDEQYAKATDMPLPPGTQVIDQVAGISYFIGQNGQPEQESRDLSEHEKTADKMRDASTLRVKTERENTARERESNTPKVIGTVSGNPQNHLVQYYVLGAIAIALVVLGAAFFWWRKSKREST